MPRRTCRSAAFLGIAALGLASCAAPQLRPELYRRASGVETRWSTFENLNGIKGAGATSNRGAKGHPSDPLEPNEKKVLLDVTGSGIITRMWFTVEDRSTETLRALRLDMYWDGAPTPAVSVPFGDFEGAILGRPVAFESALFANPEGRSFNCYIPMPFRRSARVVLTNESDKLVRHLFFDIDYVLGVAHPPDTLYFHAWWHRENPTTLQKDFEILPRVEGAGRFLGTHVGVRTDSRTLGWWGEGEVKMYVDGDTTLPTIVGTGTEDYIATGWGQGTFSQRYQGSLVSNDKLGLYAFYRYHIPDPVYFDHDIRVTLQQMGGDSKTKVVKMLDDGVPIVPVTVTWREKDRANPFVRLLDQEPPRDVRDAEFPDKAWVNYFRRDDVSAVALFYLDKAENGLPPLAPVEERIRNLE